jgi:glycosyltransferase involved in cell wall biosynthesis
MIHCGNILRKLKYQLHRSLYNIQLSLNEANGDLTRILFVAPHLSTGGMPQYLCKLIEILDPQAEVYCVEYSNVSDDYIVQRNKIQKILGERYYRIENHENKTELLQIVETICPDVIHFQDFVEFFVDDLICEKIYAPERPWFVLETCHSSSVNLNDKKWAPDKLVMVNRWMTQVFKDSGFELDVLEYPIENFSRMEKHQARTILGLDQTKKHVINVGLFTRGKNQGELFDYARQIIDLPVEFHFIGNQAINFQDYWGPLMREIPSNCKIWGERHDTDLFYQAADLFVFNSTWELNPIVIKESLSWGLPIMLRRLPSYMDDYDSNPLVHYLDRGMDKKDDAYNLSKIKEILEFVV